MVSDLEGPVHSTENPEPGPSIIHPSLLEDYARLSARNSDLEQQKTRDFEAIRQKVFDLLGIVSVF